MEKNQIIRNFTQFQKYAKSLASRLKAGDVVALVGELGAGKTTLVQYAAEELGVAQNITSPTYNIVKEYPLINEANLIHIDAFRLKGNHEDLASIEEYINDRNIVFIEWADKIKSIIPKSAKWIEIKLKNGARKIIEK